MENTNNIRRISITSETNLVSKLKLKQLIDDALLGLIPKTLKPQSGVYNNQDGQLDDNKNDVNKFGEHKYEDVTKLTKDRVTKQIDEAITKGCSALDFLLEEQKEPSKSCLSKLGYAGLMFYQSFILLSYNH
jgi:hypothetical protein